MLRTAAAVLIILAGGLVIAAADLPVVRYASVGNAPECSANQVLNLPATIDVLLLGSSRIRRGIDPEQMAEASSGQFVQVYNLGRPGRSIFRSAVLLDDLIESGRVPKVLILDADTDLIRQGSVTRWSWDRYDAGFATWGDILTDTPRPDGGIDLRLVLDGLRKKLTQSILLHTNGITASVVADRRAGPITVCVRMAPHVITSSVRAGLRKAWRRKVARYGNPAVVFDHDFVRPAGSAAKVELEMIARVRAEAEALGIRLVVVRPPGHGDPPLSPQVVASMQALVPEFRYPPERTARQLSRLHLDRNHFSYEGRLVFTRWLTEVILAETGQQK